MSYSRTYSGSVYYSGSVNVSYPASEHGGSTSAHYSGSVPVSINLHVDTTPFDRSVNDCSATVRGLTGAVVAMEGAQVVSIKNSAEEISNHVVGGFYNMINSELSQNKAALYSKLVAVSELLNDRSDTLEKQQLVMQDDFSRTERRYRQIFNTLDEELNKRVVALDKNVVNISRQVQNEQLENDSAKKIAAFLTGFNEDEIVNEQLVVATTNARVKNVLGCLADNILQDAVYSRKLDNILRPDFTKAEKQEYIPVLFAEADELSDSGAKDSFCCVPQVPNAPAENISQQVKNFFNSKVDGWKQQDEFEQQRIDSEFNHIAEDSFLNATDENARRIYNMIMELKKAGTTLTN